MKEEWVAEIKTQCEFSQVPFFFKQWGGVRKKSTGRKLEGRTWDEMPVPAVRHQGITLPCT
jgi:protein gp37